MLDRDKNLSGPNPVNLTLSNFFERVFRIRPLRSALDEGNADEGTISLLYRYRFIFIFTVSEYVLDGL